MSAWAKGTRPREASEPRRKRVESKCRVSPTLPRHCLFSWSSGEWWSEDQGATKAGLYEQVEPLLLLAMQGNGGNQGSNGSDRTNNVEQVSVSYLPPGQISIQVSRSVGFRV